ncbi:enoyl-CoA hydratase/isomerase family protein [Myxococcota bacterium]|nr:enoyl-CoA hydratase/isomerase family protein [Myxococcota bacterium]
MSKETYETIQLTKEDGVATLTLDRPDRHNAIDYTMWDELPRAWEDIKGDSDVRVVVLTGAGERAFCTGIDVQGVDQKGSPVGEGRGLEQIRFTALQNRCWKPVITAVNGMAVGGGLHFVADSDVVICSDSATFFDTHVKVGLVAGLEPVGLARRMPIEAVLRMALTGGLERMDAKRAHQLGLVSEITSQADLMPRAREIAEMIKQHSPAALARTKRAIWEGLDLGLDDALKNAWALIREHSGHPDTSEGPRAFVERRPPRWAPPEG